MAAVTTPRPIGPRAAKSERRSKDDLVMATNSSSIVSKRSVERFYYPNEPHFFRFFVRKFQRRAPLINRGYHLRLHVIDTLVRRFLQEPTTAKKMVINLGCGSDVLPWQCLTRYPEECKEAVFVDVDFPDLMLKKRQVVLNTAELTAPLADVQTPEDGPILLRSDRYFQVGCDLRDTDTLHQALSLIAEISRARLLFVAEVSITYMETEAADGLIKWASSIGQAEFCLLEQILPDGPEHPFAKTMNEHFGKLNSPLRSILQYQTIEQQEERFSSRGWADVTALSLWQAWANNDFFSPSERQKLDDVEPFDEWDELALFASHYLILHASTLAEGNVVSRRSRERLPDIPATEVVMSYKEYSTQRGLRRFGASMILKNVTGQEFIANVMGHGVHSRLRSCDVYSQNGCNIDLALEPGGPAGRMSHTITDLGSSGILLAGGRSSPMSPMMDSWLFKQDIHRWFRVEDLPVPLYRHSATRLDGSSLALLYGGKSGACDVSDKCMLYHPGLGWIECHVSGPVRPLPAFGAVLSCLGRHQGSAGIFTGILAGGMLRDGTISDQILAWQVDVANEKQPKIIFSTCSVSTDTLGDTQAARLLLSRFGATWTTYRGYLLVLGGVLRHGVVPQSHDILICSLNGSSLEIRSRVVDPRIFEPSGPPRPLIIGSSVISTAADQVVLIGGGATCFSMGTYWTSGTYAFTLDLRALDGRKCFGVPAAGVGWELARTVELVDKDEGAELSSKHTMPEEQTTVLAIQRIKIESPEAFGKMLQASKPVILEGIDLGAIKHNWSLDYLADKIGRDRKIVVHESENRSMDFNAKNFRYVTKSFGAFVEEVKSGARLYLRALATDEPASQPADLNRDFPALAADFVLPPELAFVAENSFSSVLRISGPVNMWLHYDVMANIYCQIDGTKRLVLFPPTDVHHLSFAPGASSSSIDVFEHLKTNSLAKTHPHEATLGPGDVLFLPPLWLHTATPISDSSIAVNVFFRNLENGYSAGRDVYGNRDLLAYEKGRQAVTKIVSAFNDVPAEAKQFYVQRLASELLSQAQE